MISKSPDRFSFQKESYIKGQEEAGDPISESYLDMFDNNLNAHKHRFDDPAQQKNNLEYDLLTTDWILEKTRANESYAQNLYAVMCNNDFTKRDLWPILKEQKWHCSWRYAGGIIADMRQQGDYIDWYCSGMGGLNQEFQNNETNDEWQKRTGYVPESTITEEIENDLHQLGWLVVKYNDKDT